MTSPTASYFRAVDDTYQYGLSARGLSIDTFTDKLEEFPDFVAFAAHVLAYRAGGAERNLAVPIFPAAAG